MIAGKPEEMFGKQETTPQQRHLPKAVQGCPTQRLKEK
jgi:hypothetical protein